MIRFNKPYLSGKELYYISEAIHHGKLSGNGPFTKKVHQFFQDNYGIGKSLLTTSCTDALEMAALLLDLQEGDEVIMPSYTFVSTANAFVLRGAKIVFADSNAENPNLDPAGLEALITPKTKAIVAVHYAGIACDMDPIIDLAKKHGLYVIEDAAQAIDSTYKGRQLGSIGQLGAFSFHETKNIISGEGGLLTVNDPAYAERAEIIWEKGTNRSAFFRGEVDKYGWVDMGSSFLPSEMTAAFLYAQLENLEEIQDERKAIWDHYYHCLSPLAETHDIQLPVIPDYATNNAHMFYLVFPNIEQRSQYIKYLREKGIHAVFHYLSLHKSPFYADKHDGRPLPHCDYYADGLVRLPFFFELSEEEQDYVVECTLGFFEVNG
jgi:dTDP-4-amino-4,6-dideoxygalactose transaminase